MTKKPDPGTIVQKAGSAGSARARQNDRDHLATVYYDGSCPLCTAEIGHYAARDAEERLRFVDVSSAGADLGPDLTRSEAMGRFHVRRPDGALLSGASAFVAIWQALPGWRWAARIARLPGVTPLLEVAYRLFLPIRPALSRLALRLGIRAENARSRCS